MGEPHIHILVMIIGSVLSGLSLIGLLMATAYRRGLIVGYRFSQRPSPSVGREAVAEVIERAMSAGALRYDAPGNPETWKAAVEEHTSAILACLAQPATVAVEGEK